MGIYSGSMKGYFYRFLPKVDGKLRRNENDGAKSQKQSNENPFRKEKNWKFLLR